MSEMMRKRRRGRIDIGVAHHEFFEDVVLDRARQLRLRHALFLGRDDVEREHRQHRAVHGHRHAHLVERDAGEQRAHVVDRIDRDARHADIAGHARMIAVVAAMGGEIEGDREALLPGGEIAPVEGVGIFRGGEAGILPDGPGLRGVHRGVGAAQVTARCRDRCRGSRARRDRSRHRPASPRCLPASARARPRRLAGRHGGVGEIDFREVGNLAHFTPRISCAARNVASASQPANMKVFTPACRHAASFSPGRPARWTAAPAAVSALAASAACAVVDLVGRAQAGELGARRLERGDHRRPDP